MKKWSMMSLFLSLIMLPGSVLAAGNSSPAPTVTETAKPAIEAPSVQQQPYKVAVFDILDTTGWVERDLKKNLAKRLDRELHVPLNGYLQKIKVFAPAETMAVYQSLPDDIKNSRDAAVWLKATADKLETDLVLCLTVDGAYERTWINWAGDLCYEGYAQVSLYGWDRQNGKPIKRTANRWERDACSTTNGLDALIYNLTEEILDKEKLRNRFFPEKK